MFHAFVGSVWLIALFVACSAIPDYSDLPKGPYCQTRGCCSNRVDSCSAPITETLCYCDEFCDRHRAEDCCPDYWTHCKGFEPPPEETRRACHYKGQDYLLRQTVKDNCNLCKCEVIEDVRNNKTRPDMVCERHVCLVQPDLIDSVNRNNDKFGFVATNYSKFWGRTLEDGITFRLGTLQPQRFVMKMIPVKRIYDPDSLPKSFDSEKKWGILSHIQDQFWCGSSWAISTAAVASDRFAIHSKGIEKVQLSAQHLLSCDNRGQQSCHGGHLDRAWMYFRKFGIVDEQCFPYTGELKKCHIPKKGNLLTAKCFPPQNIDRTEKYRVAPAYRLGNETDIMYEILNSGPVQATMKVYHDFYGYKGGIYKQTGLAESDRTGYLSVRIIGWGTELTHYGHQKYWKIANSWGADWGENGYFRIARGSNECEIESFVLGTWPEIHMDMRK